MKADKNNIQKIASSYAPPTPVKTDKKPTLGSLKALIKQSRVPLSQYINDKRYTKTTNLNSLSYFDKMKAKFIKPHEEIHQQALLETYYAHQPAKNQNQHFNKQALNYLTQFKPSDQKQHCKTRIADDITDNHRKNRSKSTNAHLKAYHPQSNIKLPLHVPTSNKNVNLAQRGMAQHMQSQKNIHHEYLYPKFKELKKQIINYNSKFIQIYHNSSLQQFSGFLELDETLGRGANSVVRIGKDKKTKCMFAVKIYEKYKLIEVSKRKRVTSQIQILASIDHQNIIKIISCFQDKRQIHILFEYLPQVCNLHDHLRANLNQLTLQNMFTLAIQITDAVAYLHQQGIAHRDLKTDNVVISNDGALKLIDFGYASRVQDGEGICGTPNYMAPELFVKKPVYNSIKVDLWALGILLFYLFQGRYPFRGYNQRQLCRNINTCRYQFSKSNNIQKSIIQSLLIVDPNNRSNAVHISQMLRQGLQGLSAI